MTHTTERFPELEALPRRALVAQPTPVRAMPRLSKMTGAELWVKRDDLTSPRYGGNKVRKLELLLGEARRRDADTLITAGAFGSHHVLATALHGAAAGLGVHAVLVPQPWSEHVSQNLRADVSAGAMLHPVRHLAQVPFVVRRLTAELRAQGKSPMFIPHGGSSPLGALGYVEAGLELAAQIDAGELPEPDAIYVAYGSGGTAAGLAIGLAAAGITAKVIAVRVTDVLLANRALLLGLVRASMGILRKGDPRFPAVGALAASRLEIDASAFAPGYGVSTSETRRAVELGAAEGLVVDETYTGRALHVCLKQMEAGRFKRALFWHTLSSADLGALLRRVPAPPRWTERYTRPKHLV